MEKSKGKISVRQALILFIVLTYSPSVRFAANSTSRIAKQAAWLVPTVTSLILFIMIYLLNKLLKGYKDKSFSEMIYDITSKFWGKVIVSLYFCWISIVIALYIRYNSERLVSSLYPNVNMNVFTLSLLILIGFIIRNGIVVIARMGELFLIIILLITIILFTLMLPTVDINNLVPISYLDVLPILKSSMSGAALFYLVYLLFFTHKVSRQQEFLKYGNLTVMFIWFLNTTLIIASVGNLGHEIVSRSPLYFFLASKHITLLGTVSGFESILVITWILSDFIMIIVLIFACLNIAKSLFNLSSYNSFVNIYLVTLYLFSLILAANLFELQEFSKEIVVYINVLMQIIVPVIIVLIAKTRKKI
ncbi:GerAB/ArcD/ProY family transporter [Mycoplasmatota bacterium WC44]